MSDELGGAVSEGAEAPEGPTGAEALAALEGVLGRMGLDVTVEQVESDDRACRFKVEGPDAEVLIKREAAVLEALQYLVNRMMGKATKGNHPPVQVDAGGYREHHRQEIEDEAKDMAAEARETGQAVWAGDLTPYERRIVHMVIAEEDGVESKSDGEGPDRRLRVVPKARPSDPGP
jgi:spoIIIJ-associated protein